MIYKKEIIEQAVRVLSIEQPDEIKDAISLACGELTPKTRDSASILPAHILTRVHCDLANGMTIGESQNPKLRLSDEVKGSLRGISNKDRESGCHTGRFHLLDHFFERLHTAYGLRVCRNLLDARKSGIEASDLAKEIRRSQILNHFEAAGIEVKGKPLGRLVNSLTRPAYARKKGQTAQNLSQA